MSFIRPGAQAALSRWRDALIGLALTGLGLYWSLAGIGLIVWIGYLVAPVGAILAFLGWQRARIRGQDDGPGIVKVVEGQIMYFGPLSGGTLALDTLRKVELDTESAPHAFWLFQPESPPVAIPVGAVGTEMLIDTLATLPGLDFGRIAAALENPHPRRQTLWHAQPNSASALTSPRQTRT